MTSAHADHPFRSPNSTPPDADNEASFAEKKRLFIGFPVHVADNLHTALKRTKINAQRREMEVNWVPEANFHVTLCFLGTTNTEKIAKLRETLARVAALSPPIDTSLKGMGGFPDERHMRVLYVGVRKSRALAELQSRIRDALRAAGFEQEDREYKPHLTVARLRKGRSGTDLLSPYVRTSFGDIGIRSFILFESLTYGPHSVYKPVAHYELSGQTHQDLAYQDLDVIESA